MVIFHTDEFVLPLPEGHRFPMEKYRLLREAVARDPELGGARLLRPAGATDVELLRVHTHDWVSRVVGGALSPAEVRRIGFPWSEELVERSRRSVGGTLDGARSALTHGAGANLAGGTHHALEGQGEGFCVFNDAAVAIRALQWEGLIRTAAVVDTDVHQGNGTARIFQGDPSVFTASLHGASNFPFRKEAGDLDLPLPDGAGDAAFQEAVDHLLARAVEEFQPDLVVYLAGADAWSGDRLGRLDVSRTALARRDRRVVEATIKRGIPLVLAMAGGYGDPVTTTVGIHLQSIRTAFQALRSPGVSIPADWAGPPPPPRAPGLP